MSDVTSGVERGVEPTGEGSALAVPEPVQSYEQRRAYLLSQLESVDQEEAAAAVPVSTDEDSKVKDLLSRLRLVGTADEVANVKQWLSEQDSDKQPEDSDKQPEDG